MSDRTSVGVQMLRELADGLEDEGKMFEAALALLARWEATEGEGSYRLWSETQVFLNEMRDKGAIK